MKKLIGILVILGALLLPSTVKAVSYRVNYYCDSKVPQSDGTFTMNCHLLMNSSSNINHIQGNLILKNVRLESIKTNSDWSSNNGSSINVDFTSPTTHSGSFSVADFVFTGDLKDTECEASFNPQIVEETKPESHVCAIVDNKYYGKNGNVVSEVAYYEECCNYVCTVVNNEFYFDSHGKSVTYDKMLEDCSTQTIVNPSTGIDYGYVLLPIGILGIFAIIKFSKKNTKIYKI